MPALKPLWKDLEAGGGKLIVSLTDDSEKIWTDKTAGEIFAALEAGKAVWFKHSALAEGEEKGWMVYKYSKRGGKYKAYILEEMTQGEMNTEFYAENSSDRMSFLI